MTRTITEHACLRCGHDWFPRKLDKPTKCPKCNSPYWDKPRTREKGGRPKKKKEGQ